MTIYGALNIPTLGMRAQAHALDTISLNIANISTGGYKAAETRFSTLVSRSLFNESDLSGPRPYDITRIANQGLFVQGSDLDVAINGTGFFVLNSALDSSGKTFYGRDGAFEIALGGVAEGTTTGTTQTPTTITGPDGGTIQTLEGYLADKNGYFLQGWVPEADGTFSDSGALQSLRVDQYAFTGDSQATTDASLFLNLPGLDEVGDQANTYNISLVDSGGNKQSASLSFTKASVDNPLLWNMTATTTQATVAQVDTVNLSGTVETGDRYTVNVDGNTVTYTATATDTTLDNIRDGLVTLINGSGNLSSLVTAAAGASGALTLTARSAGTAFTTTATATNNAGPTAQVQSLTLGGTFEIGDTYSVAVNGTTYSYTATLPDADLNDVAAGLAGEINIGEAGIVTAAAAGAGGIITLTADTAGTPFTIASPTAVNGGAINDQTNASALTQANITSTNDQAAANVTTTANVTSTTTGTPTVLTFSSDGTLASPETVALTLGFAEGTSANVTLDVSGLTAFAGDFNPTKYESNGYANAAMTSFNFDALGQVIGKFEDGTNRVIYKLPVAVFSNPNGLYVENGNVFSASETSGTAQIAGAGTNGFATFLPGTRELSNVNLADEFSRMIRTQSVYNAAATDFRTIDEMLQVARDLKR